MRHCALPPNPSLFAHMLFALTVGLSALMPAACSDVAGGSSPSGQSAPGSIAGSGDDMYYEYSITSTGKDISMTGYTKLYVSSGGGLRSEMDLINPAARKTAPIVTIGNKDKPNQSIMIDDSAKTWSLNLIDTMMSTPSNGLFKISSTVTKVGEEKIMGFTCIHARVISTRSMGALGKLTDTVELWNSPNVPMAPFFRHFMDKSFSKSWASLMSPEATDQLKQMGCAGFMVKIHSGSPSSGMNMELTKVQKGDFPKSMFEVPIDYKEDKQ